MCLIEFSFHQKKKLKIKNKKSKEEFCDAYLLKSMLLFLFFGKVIAAQCEKVTLFGDAIYIVVCEGHYASSQLCCGFRLASPHD
jgi:hypothetical protein